MHQQSHFCFKVNWHFNNLFQSELFQRDLFPDTQGDEPSLLASDWFEGQDAEPKKVSLNPGDGGGAKGANKPKKGLRGLGKMAPKKKEAKADDDEVVSSKRVAILQLCLVEIITCCLMV